MKIITSKNGKSIRLGYAEWIGIGKTSGWLKECSQDKSNLFDQEKKNAIRIIGEIKAILESGNHVVSGIKDLPSGKLGIDAVDGHRVDIEVRPFVSESPKSFKTRSGVIIMAGGYSNKHFKRKRFSPKHLERIGEYVESVIAHYDKKSDQRAKRQDRHEKNREKELEIARQDAEIGKEAKIKKNPKQKIEEDREEREQIEQFVQKKRKKEELRTQQESKYDQEWVELFKNSDQEFEREFLEKYLLNPSRPFHFGPRIFTIYNKDKDMETISASSLSDIESKSGMIFGSNLRRKNFIRFLYDIDYGFNELGNSSRKGKSVWIFLNPVAKAQNTDLLEWGSSDAFDSMPNALKKHDEQEEIGDVIMGKDPEESKKNKDETHEPWKEHPFSPLSNLQPSVAWSTGIYMDIISDSKKSS